MKRLLSLIVVLCVALTILSGCGTAATTPEKTASTVAQAESSAAPAVAEPAAEEPAKEVTIKWLHHFSEEGMRKWIDIATQTFTEKNPNIKFEVSATSFDNYFTMLKTKIAGGDAPDLFDLDSLQTHMEFLDNGYIADLSDQAFLQNIQPFVVEGAKVAGKGKVYTLPTDSGGFVVVYDKDVFQKAGITDVPKTWSEFIKTCEKLKAAGVTPIGAGYKEWWVLACDIVADYIHSQFKVDPQWIDTIQSGAQTFSEDKAGFKVTLERLRERNKYVNEDPFGTDWNKATELLATGKVAMIINGTWTVDAVKSKRPEANLGMFGFPISENPDEAMVTLGASGGYVVFDKSPVKDSVFKFMEYITTKEMGKALQDNKKAQSTVKDLPADFDPAFNDLVKYQQEGKVWNMSNIRRDFDDQHVKVFYDTITRYLLDNKMSTDECLKLLDEEFAKLAKSNK